jgi:hypothetical protein
LIIGQPNSIKITEKFLQFEHTDGLNYVNTEFSRHDDISSIFNITNTDKIQVNLTEGVGLGLLYPKQTQHSWVKKDMMIITYPVLGLR